MRQVTLKTGETLVIRKAGREDATGVLNCVNTISGQSDFLTFGPGEFGITLEQEQLFLENISRLENAIYAVAELKGKIIGTASFTGGPRPRIAHTGELGISILKEHWRKGIGTEILNYIIDWAQNTGIIRKINLRVRTDNHPAIHLYKKLGFVQCGIMTRDIKIEDNFYDSILMGYDID